MAGGKCLYVDVVTREHGWFRERQVEQTPLWELIAPTMMRTGPDLTLCALRVVPVWMFRRFGYAVIT